MATLTVHLPDSDPVEIEVGSDLLSVGRSDGNVLMIADASVSGSHAELVETSDGLLVRDLGSTNGTKLNGERIEEAFAGPGDEIRFGSIVAFVAGAVEAVRSTSSEGLEPQVGGDGAAPTASDFIPAQTSVKPTSFGSASPFPKRSADRDGLRMAAFGMFILSLLIFTLATFAAYAMPTIS